MARSALMFAGLAALALAACETSAGEDPFTYLDEGADLTPIMSWRDEGASVRVRVPSKGCTTKDSFHVDVYGAPDAGWAFEMALIRTHADNCRAMLPSGVELSWTKDELGLPDGADLRVVNPRNHDFY